MGSSFSDFDYKIITYPLVSDQLYYKWDAIFTSLSQLIMQNSIFLEICYICGQNSIQAYARSSFYFSFSISFTWEKSIRKHGFALPLGLSWLPVEKKKCYQLPWQSNFPRAPCCTSFALNRNNHYYSMKALINFSF